MKLHETLSDDLLDRVARRLASALRARYAMPYHALLYRIGEVSQHRVEPRLLRRALTELSNERRPRRGRVQPGPWEPYQNCFASADLSADEAHAEAAEVIPLLRTLTTFQLNSLDRLTEHITLLLGNTARVEPGGGFGTAVKIAGDVTIEAGQRFVTAEPEGGLVHIWITYEPDWIHPDDVRLWRFLLTCEQRGARPLIVARKIAVATFPLLKVLCCQGVQYYSTFVSDEAVGEANAIRDRVGWSYIRSVEEFPGTPATTQLLEALGRLVSHTETNQARHAIQDGLVRGFAERVTPDLLLAWWQDSGLDLPRGMVQTLERWSTWEELNESSGTD